MMQMIRYSTYLATVFISLSVCCVSCRKEANELAHTHEHHEHEGQEGHEGHESHDETDAHGEEEAAGTIILEPAVAERFGLTTEKAERANLSTSVLAGATVSVSEQASAVVSAPVAGVVALSPNIYVGVEVTAGATVANIKPGIVAGGDAMLMAKVDLDAAKAEYDRVAALYADQLVTVSEYNAARAAFERAQAAYSAPAASGRAVAPVTGVITALNVRTGEAVEAGQTIATLASGNSLTLSAMMPVSDYARIGLPRDVRVVFPYTGKTLLLSEAGGRPVASKNALAAASGGYIPVTFTVPADAGLLPGTTVEAYLIGGSEAEALIVPRRALTEQQGSYSVYVRLDDDCYVQVPVTVGGSDGENVEILSGLKGGEDVVVEGVTAVRLASMSGSVPAGHSHSH